jgi:hypothetical protein
MTSLVDRIYFVSCPYYITEEEFKAQYEYKIRYANAHFPNCQFIIVSDRGNERVNECIRRIGACPTRVTICYVDDGNGDRAGNSVLKNPYKSPTLKFSSVREQNIYASNNSTHDILWVCDGDTKSYVYQNKMRRAEILKTRPYIKK